MKAWLGIFLLVGILSALTVSLINGWWDALPFISLAASVFALVNAIATYRKAGNMMRAASALVASAYGNGAQVIDLDLLAPLLGEEVKRAKAQARADLEQVWAERYRRGDQSDH